VGLFYLVARPERFELPTAWFVVFRLNSRILLISYAFMRFILSNKIGLFGLICLYLRLFGAIYWTGSSASHTQSFLIQAASSRVKSITEYYKDRAVAQGRSDWSSSA